MSGIKKKSGKCHGNFVRENTLLLTSCLWLQQFVVTTVFSVLLRAALYHPF